MSPGQLTVGDDPPTLALRGSGFVAASRATVNGSDRATQFLSGTELHTQLLVSDIDSARSLAITVANPAPGGGVSASISLSAAFANVTMASVAPDYLVTGSTNSVTIVGAGFSKYSQVFLHGQEMTGISYVGPATMHGPARPSVAWMPGNASLEVRNPESVAATRQIELRTPSPEVVSILPDSVYQNSGATIVYLTGSNFRPGSVVYDGGPTIVGFDSSRVAVFLAATDLSTARTATITVTNALPTVGAPVVSTLRILPQRPNILSFSPASVIAGSSGVELTVNGLGFDPDAVVEVGGNAYPTAWVTTTQLRVSVAAATLANPGALAVRVRNGARGNLSPMVGWSVLPPSLTLGAPTTLMLANKHIVADPVRSLIYASVPGGAAVYANSIVKIDPQTGTVVGSALLGGSPGQLAISDNGQYLYAALDSAPRVERVRLSDFTADAAIVLPDVIVCGEGRPQDEGRTQDLEVMPGAPALLAVSVRATSCFPQNFGLFLYSGTEVLSEWLRDTEHARRIAVGSSANELYSYEDERTHLNEFRRIDVMPNGLRRSSYASLFEGSSTDIEASGTLVFSTNGAVVSPATMTRVGTIGNFGTDASRRVRPDAANARVHFLSGATITTYNWSSLQEMGSAVVDGALGRTSLIRWGQDGLAMGGGDRIVIVRGSLVATP